MSFERRFSKVVAKEKKKEFFGPDGHFTSFGIEEWLYGDVSYRSQRKNHRPGKEHLAMCKTCSGFIQQRRLTDPGDKSHAVPVGDRD